MARQLSSIGIFNNNNGRRLVIDNLTKAFYDSSSILKKQENGRIVRESLLSAIWIKTNKAIKCVVCDSLIGDGVSVIKYCDINPFLLT